jgi:hypothetical protein
VVEINGRLAKPFLQKGVLDLWGKLYRGVSGGGRDD